MIVAGMLELDFILYLSFIACRACFGRSKPCLAFGFGCFLAARRERQIVFRRKALSERCRDFSYVKIWSVGSLINPLSYTRALETGSFKLSIIFSIFVPGMAVSFSGGWFPKDAAGDNIAGLKQSPVAISGLNCKTPMPCMPRRNSLWVDSRN